VRHHDESWGCGVGRLAPTDDGTRRGSMPGVRRPGDSVGRGCRLKAGRATRYVTLDLARVVPGWGPGHMTTKELLLAGQCGPRQFARPRR